MNRIGSLGERTLQIPVENIGPKLKGQGNDARFVKTLCYSSLNSFGRNPFTIDETGFLTLARRPSLLPSLLRRSLGSGKSNNCVD